LAQDCQAIRAEADRIGEEKDQAQATSLDLAKAFEGKLAALEQAGLTPPMAALKAIEVLDPKQPAYQKERGLCVINGVAWGTVKDLREYKRDSLEHEIQEVLLRLQLLDGVQETAATPSPPQAASREVAAAQSTAAFQAQRQIYQQKAYAYCVIDPARTDLRIDHRRSPEAPHGFDLLARVTQEEGHSLAFAMNAGMYHPDKQPVGLLVSEGKVWGTLNTSSGTGNFYLQPNGVFWVDITGEAMIETTEAFNERKLSLDRLRVATQSGPMLMYNGDINRAFQPNSPNLHFRNAVGLTEDDRVVFVISEQQVCFHDLTVFMREALGCIHALYLDGSVSRMYLPAINKQTLNDSQHLGPILYVVE
jgi:uncharacterized protein YigE (DUF2233 family)